MLKSAGILHLRARNSNNFNLKNKLLSAARAILHRQNLILSNIIIRLTNNEIKKKISSYINSLFPLQE